MKPKPFKFLIGHKEKEINFEQLVNEAIRNGFFRDGPTNHSGERGTMGPIGDTGVPGTSGPVGIMGVEGRNDDTENTLISQIIGRMGYSYGDTGPIGLSGPMGITGGDHHNQLALSGSSGPSQNRDLNDQMLRSSDVYRLIDETKDILPKGLRSLLEVGVNYIENEDYEPLNNNLVVNYLRSSILFLYFFGVNVFFGTLLINKLLNIFV